MEVLVGGLIIVQVFALYFNSRDRQALLNAVVAKSTPEYLKLQQTPKRKVRKPEPLQDDAGIPFGL